MGEWNIRWSDQKDVLGEERVSGTKILDAINAFLKEKGNKGKTIVGIELICEKLKKRKKRLKDYESDY